MTTVGHFSGKVAKVADCDSRPNNANVLRFDLLLSSVKQNPKNIVEDTFC